MNKHFQRKGLLRPPGARLLRFVGLHFARKQKHGGKRSVYAELNLTSMVDMLTILVVFLLQTFSASGELLQSKPGIKIAEVPYSSTEQASPKQIVISISNADVFVDECAVCPTSWLLDTQLFNNVIEKTRECLRTVENKKQLQQSLATDKKRTIVIQADGDILYGQTALVQKAAQLQGYTEFLFPAVEVKPMPSQAK